jgi:uncharacterized protein (DUF1697 family)
MTRYVALLRGINVGGNNLIKMSALKSCFEAHGFEDAKTYIASGNVLFSASDGRAALVERIEAMLSETFAYPASVVVRSRKQMSEIVEGAPNGFGDSPDEYRYDVIFLKEPLSAATALNTVPAREGVDEVYAGSGVLYYSRLSEKAAQSKLTKVIGMPIYKSMTIRNWNTTTKLLALMGGSER